MSMKNNLRLGSEWIKVVYSVCIGSSQVGGDFEILKLKRWNFQDICLLGRYSRWWQPISGPMSHYRSKPVILIHRDREGFLRFKHVKKYRNDPNKSVLITQSIRKCKKNTHMLRVEAIYGFERQRSLVFEFSWTPRFILGTKMWYWVWLI